MANRPVPPIRPLPLVRPPAGHPVPPVRPPKGPDDDDRHHTSRHEQHHHGHGHDHGEPGARYLPPGVTVPPRGTSGATESVFVQPPQRYPRQRPGR